jgi:hypothetical protein
MSAALHAQMKSKMHKRPLPPAVGEAGARMAKSPVAISKMAKIMVHVKVIASASVGRRLRNKRATAQGNAAL